jgi:hypothetical protein
MSEITRKDKTVKRKDKIKNPKKDPATARTLT